MTEQVTVTVSLSDGTSRTLDRDAVLEAAGADTSLVADTDDRAEVILDNGSRYDALKLIARTLQVGDDLIRPRQAIVALRELRLLVDDGTPTVLEPKERPEPYEGSLLDSDEGAFESGLSDDLPPNLARTLRKWRGQWVAIKSGEVISNAEALRTLLSQVEDMDVTVMFVPLRDDHE